MNDLEVLFPSDRFTLLVPAESIHTVHTLPTGEVVKVPAYAILRQRHANLSFHLVVRSVCLFGCIRQPEDQQTGLVSATHQSKL